LIVISKLSLTARLTIWFATASAIVLLALGWLIGVSIDHHFELLDHNELTGKMLLVENVVERVSSEQDLEHLPAKLSDALVGHHDLFIRVRGPRNEELYASPKLEFPRESEEKPQGDSESFEWTEGDHTYRGLKRAISTRVLTWPPLKIELAVGMEVHMAFMQTVMQTLWIFVVCAAAATGLLGWIVAKRSLAPLEAMRKRAALVAGTV
jgi:two-component system heavy metal sensor histidine kinase CusS